MFRFLHASDLHLDSPLRGLETYQDAPVAQIRGASRRAMDALVELALAEQVSFLVVAGDLFDGDWKDYHTALFLADRFGRLGNAGIPVYLASGNHDAASVISRTLRLPGNVRVFSSASPQTFIDDRTGAVLHGQGYPHWDLTDNLSVAYPPAHPAHFNIGVLHTALTGRAGHARYAPCSLDDLRSKGYQYWALGHLHQPEVVCRDPWIVFPGCIQGRHIREQGPKGAMMVTVDEGSVVDVEPRAVDVLRWGDCTVAVDRCGTWGELLDAVRLKLSQAKSGCDGRPLAVRVSLTGACRISQVVQDRQEALFEEIGTLAAGMGDIWLEQVTLAFRPSSDAVSGRGSTSPFKELIDSLSPDGLDLESIARDMPELSEFKSKLPSDATSGDEPFDPLDPSFLRSIKGEIAEMLVARLTRTGGDA
jgi:DNA repair protein SbcD/Mre11